MLEKLLQLLAPRQTDSAVDREERLRLATCIVLLEVAGADNEFSPAECQLIIDSLRTRFDLLQEEAEELIEVAQERRQEASGLWKYTNQINQSCSVEEKVGIIEEVWRVIYADGSLDGHEDYLVHKLADLMNLTHPQLIEAKMRVSRPKA
ncbi:MAG: TerB family tellurite resistance protein [Candidatus Hydrogenedentes bacterium]|nr:TerB family tellurite resistance protein [Candidatus Hydrogenedentota bacterium]